MRALSTRGVDHGEFVGTTPEDKVSEVWASSAFAGTGDVFETLHSGLTVKLVSTPRHQLETCGKHEQASVVLGRNPDHFDFIPVLEDRIPQGSRFIGLFNASEARKDRKIEGPVSASYRPLTEEYLIGADASILEFVVQADSHPCRLVVSGPQIVGLVTLSDLQRLPVRAALFALITGFEMTMIDYIKAVLPEERDWMALLKPIRLEKIQAEISVARAKDAFVDTLLYTQFCDKADIVASNPPTTASKKSLERRLRAIEKLRNSVAHANEYAASPEEARDVCVVIRDLLDLRRQLTIK